MGEPSEQNASHQTYLSMHMLSMHMIEENVTRELIAYKIAAHAADLADLAKSEAAT